VSESGYRPSLLYISPVVPSLSGNGLAMRAGMVLEALAEYCRVSLLVVPLYPPFEQQVAEVFRKRCLKSAIVWRPDYRDQIRQAAETYRDSRFDIVHVFRLAAVPSARAYLQGKARCDLDLDDIESKTHRRLASLYRANGDALMAGSEEAEARRSELLEAVAFQEFDRVYVCSEEDKNELLARCRAELRVLPNAVRVPDAVGPCGTDDVCRLLFVGTLGYYPNQDAVTWFCQQILPHIRQKSPVGVRVDIVGAGCCERLRDIAAASAVHLAGQVLDVRPWYEAARAVIVPIRAAGGTRIKILEAFSYQRPVVTTSIGVEGIQARPGEHVLVGDTPEAFASLCVQLITDPRLAQNLVENARSLLLRCYSAETLKRSVASPPAVAVRPVSQSDGG